MKMLNIGTPVTRNFIPQILLNVQEFYFHNVGYTSYDEGVFELKADFLKKGYLYGKPVHRKGCTVDRQQYAVKKNAEKHPYFRQNLNTWSHAAIIRKISVSYLFTCM
jgi:hypothetical protein